MAEIQIEYKNNVITANLTREEEKGLGGLSLWILSINKGKEEVPLMKIAIDNKGNCFVTYKQKGFVLPLEEIMKHIETDTSS